MWGFLILQNLHFEGFSEDDDQDGFVDPVGQVAPLTYPAPTYAVPTVTYAFAPGLTNYYTKTSASANFVHAYAHPFGWTLPGPAR